jgi:hypothetical protein
MTDEATPEVTPEAAPEAEPTPPEPGATGESVSKADFDKLRKPRSSGSKEAGS